ncbi:MULTISPECIES: hypothetical protein [unclassified Streptomyces]|uniref:hypothetical protein n=1 Tax=unclassified Streptomyces TaxID=2593676 RepID=UPI00081B3D02|nr:MULTISPECIES: hypothetical protein [unclassified Streptomyces]MYQ83479.1 hypothetical protein [Streptomyces sp. SID4936]SCD67053.1 hypothetical protein GA0115234_1041298 [Streptomyces sp. DvalAA-43]
MTRIGLLAARTLVVAAASALLVTGTAQAAAPAKYAKHEDAAAVLRKAGVTWTSSGGCSNWNKRTCTSFTRINKASVEGVIAFKKASGCKVVITGGTEAGHSSGTYSHRNGYKTDISTKVSCVNTYITRKFAKAGKRSDGAALYKSPAGNVYANEGSHWDITHYNGKA